MLLEIGIRLASLVNDIDMPDYQSFEVPTLLRLLNGIDRLPRGATGALVFASKDAPQGTVLVEENRVCWAAASNMEHRLTDILRHESDPPLPKAVFNQIYEECHRDRIPLGETLVERGIVTPEGLSHALRRHTAEAICVLASSKDLAPVWASNRQRPYDAQHTFSTGELMSCVGAFGFDEEAERAEHALRALTPMASVGMAYLEKGHELPVAQVGVDGWDCTALVELGQWARKALTAAENENEVRDEIRRAWRDGPLVYVSHSNHKMERRLQESVLV